MDLQLMNNRRSKFRFEWDDAKCDENVARHGLDFADAAHVFLGKTFTVVDERRDYGENRLITWGELKGDLVAIVHVERGDRIRIISARYSSESEKSKFRSAFTRRR